MELDKEALLNAAKAVAVSEKKAHSMEVLGREKNIARAAIEAYLEALVEKTIPANLI